MHAEHLTKIIVYITKTGVGNLWTSSFCWTPTPISPSQHGQYPQVVGVVVQQYLQCTIAFTPDLHVLGQQLEALSAEKK